MINTTTSGFLIILYFFFLAATLLVCHIKKYFKLDHRSLFHQKLFWLSITIPFVSFIYFGLFSWIGHKPDLSAEGFEIFYNISKVPLFFLAASVPLASIVNNVHRTIQTEKQINEAEKKNLSDSYFTHFKHTLDLFKSIESNEIHYQKAGKPFTLQLNNPVRLYNLVFTESSYITGSNFTINKEFTNNLINEWKIINNSIGKLSALYEKGSRGKRGFVVRLFINICRIESSYEKICRILLIQDNFGQLPRTKIEFQTSTYYGIFHDDSYLKSAILALDKVCSKIFDVISISSGNNSTAYPSKFLERKVAISFAGYGPTYMGRLFYSDTPQLILEERRQSGGIFSKRILKITKNNDKKPS